MTSRRGFLAGLAAAFVIDPEKLLFVPGKKTFSIPADPGVSLRYIVAWDPVRNVMMRSLDMIALTKVGAPHLPVPTGGCSSIVMSGRDFDQAYARLAAWKYNDLPVLGPRSRQSFRSAEKGQHVTLIESCVDRHALGFHEAGLLHTWWESPASSRPGLLRPLGECELPPRRPEPPAPE